MPDTHGNISSSSRDNLMRALAVVDAAGSELADGLMARQTQSLPLERIVAPSESESARRSHLAATWLEQITKIDLVQLPQEIQLSVRLAQATANRIVRELPWYWHVYDPLSLGFFGMFGPTAYCGGWSLSVIAQLLQKYRFTNRGDCDRYLGLVADVVAVVHGMRVRLTGQHKRGIFMPRAQLMQAQKMMDALRSRVELQLAVSAERLRETRLPSGLDSQLRGLIEDDLRSAFQSLHDYLKELAGNAPFESVGMSSYAGGAEIYAELVKLHTTLELEVDEVHRIGKERMLTIEEQMAVIRSEAGFKGTNMEFWSSLGSDPRFSGATIEDVTSHFERCIDRVEPLLSRWLHRPPASPCSVAPLPDSLAASMTFGYYQVPAKKEDTGRYLFNARNLTRGTLAHVPALTFHELVPGHHVHLSAQAQDDNLPALHRYNSFNAFNEGWAEYAATLAGEHGLYQSPQERFGRLMMDAFLSCRLVVDTGLNAFGWSLEYAQRYLQENGFMSPTEAGSESLRYACDLPGQALAYKLGDTFLLEQRARMQAALGTRFDLRDFHQAVLQNGALPLSLVSRQIDRAIVEIAERSSN